ncbi:MAG: DUF2271 domain-containing protein [Cardiobacteriaceae bacterium]|nr:DUF2271 domain-containing protein [Cardiobacteriaceae bacterium]
MKKLILCSSLLLAVSAQAVNLNLELTIPEIKSSEYHRPYIAVWIEDSDHKLVEYLSLWYNIKGKEENPKEGMKYLKELRNWWRKGGRSLKPLPDAITGATQKPGKHNIEIKSDDPRLAKLKDGKYTLMIEATREEGGTENLSIPFTLPIKERTEAKASGTSELGDVNLTLTP